MEPGFEVTIAGRYLPDARASSRRTAPTGRRDRPRCDMSGLAHASGRSGSERVSTRGDRRRPRRGARAFRPTRSTAGVAVQRERC